ncbi:MAG: sugar transferase [Planctomycetota bacterium]|jgi:exopolysaccharide biosynthesis polyprenyl glycosylphosphotransferase
MLLARRTGLRAAVAALLDIAATALAFAGAMLVRQKLGGWSLTTPTEYAAVLGALLAIQTVTLAAFGCYGRRTLGSLLVRMGEALVLSHLCLAIVTFYAKAQFLSRGVVLLLFPLNYLAILVLRIGVVRLIFGNARPRVLVVGMGESAVSLARTLGLSSWHEIVGFVGAGDGADRAEGPVLGEPPDIADVLAANAPVDSVAIPADAEEEVVRFIYAVCRDRGVEVMRTLDPPDGANRTVSVEPVGDRLVLVERSSRAGAFSLLVKRLMDIVGAVVGLLLIAPFAPLIALLIKGTSRGPVLFRQRRVGLNGRIFNLYKFRTMVDGAEGMRDDLLHLNEARGPHFKIDNDPRLTVVGRLLRRTSLDEFPQFWNVLKGDMSLVGPRPLPVKEVEQRDSDHCRRLRMRPGITGMWQAYGRSAVADFADIVRMDDDYIRNWSIWLDVRLILQTIPAVLSGRGAR